MNKKPVAIKQDLEHVGAHVPIYMPITELKLNETNPRNIEDDKFTKLVRSIKSFPKMLEIRPIVIDENNVILGGNMRYNACIKAGLERVPVLQIQDFTEEQKSEFIIKDNVGFGTWDWEILQKDWDADLLDEWGMDLEFNTLDDDNEGLTDENDVPEIAEVPISKFGNVWLLGQHRVMCGDSTSKEEIKTLINGVKVDMVFTDPPYGMSYGGGRTNKFDMIKGDDIDPTAFYHAVPDVREVYIWGRVENFKHLKSNPKHTIVWKKNNFGLGRGYRGQYEVCFYWGEFKGSDTDVWEIAKDRDYVHPTQKPVELCLRAIKNSSPKNILDLYSGSGSTLIACEKKNLPFMGMEFDPKYVDVVIKRWQEYTGKEAVLESTGETFNLTKLNENETIK